MHKQHSKMTKIQLITAVQVLLIQPQGAENKEY